MALDPRQAVRLLVDERSKLIAYLWSIVQDAAAAEDLFQDVLIEVMEKADQIRDTEHLRRWARQAGRFRAIDLIRRRKLEKAVLSERVVGLLESHWERTDRIDAAEMLEALVECMGQLSADAREMVRMRYVDDLTGRQIADRLGRQRQSVYMAMTRIYKALARCVHRRVDGGGATP